MPKSLDTVKALSKTFASIGSPEEQVANIEKEGQLWSSSLLRTSIIGGLELRPRHWPQTAENLIHLGCACFGTAKVLTSYCKLLQLFDEHYVFLRKEYCCGMSLILDATVRGDETALKAGESNASRFLGLNIDEARRMGAKRMYYCCSWCVYASTRFHGDSDVKQHYYLDHVVGVITRFNPKLQLKGRIGYYGGGQHRRHVYVPGITWDFDWPGYRKLLDRVDGLEIVDVPKYCCVTHPDLINKVIEKESITTLVTPCTACYGRMSRKVPEGVEVISIPQLLLRALEPNAQVSDPS